MLFFKVTTASSESCSGEVQVAIVMGIGKVKTAQWPW